MSTLRRISLLTAVLLLAVAPSLRAQAKAHGSGDDATELRVVNNHGYRVAVVLVDSDGRHQALGRVSHGSVRIFALDDDGSDAARFRIKVFTDEPVWSPANTDEAIRTQDLAPAAGQSVTFWVEPDLTRSRVTLGR